MTFLSKAFTLHTGSTMAPTLTIHFNPAGGPVSAKPSAGQAAPGSYGLLLLEHDGLTMVSPSPWSARFDGASTNTHQLPGSARDNDGRILDLVASVGLMDATRAYAVHLSVLQDGIVLGTVSDAGTDSTNNLTHESELLVVLSGVASVVPMNASLRSLIVKPTAETRAPSRTSRVQDAMNDARAHVLDSTESTNSEPIQPKSTRGAKKRGNR